MASEATRASPSQGDPRFRPVWAMCRGCPLPYRASCGGRFDRGGGVGLLFQPRWSDEAPRHAESLAGADMPSDRGIVFLAALQAVVLGDASRFADLFTDDIVITSPHLVADSL